MTRIQPTDIEASIRVKLRQISEHGTSRVLWDRAAGVWTFGANDTENVIGSVYGPS